MENKPENPRAFPFINSERLTWEAGMTLRDYFANSAMQGMISNPNIVRPGESDSDFYNFTQRAYKYADAMLKQREL